jgi:hypothetical protein
VQRADEDSFNRDFEKALEEMSPCHKAAFLQYCDVVSRYPELHDEADSVIYERVTAQLDGEDAVEFDTWTRYLRHARSRLGIRKKNRRSMPEGRSIVRRHDQ